MIELDFLLKNKFKNNIKDLIIYDFKILTFSQNQDVYESLLNYIK